MEHEGSTLSLFNAVTRLIRSGDYADAASRLNSALRLLEPLIRSYGHEQQKSISYSLETLLFMQQNGDWVACADVIEFELLKLL